MDTLKIRLREAREIRNFSQSTLGQLAGCGQEKISAYEVGKLQPRLCTLVHIADALQVPTDYLLGRTDRIRATLEDVLTEEEVDMILRYRALPQEKKLKLSGIVIGLGE